MMLTRFVRIQLVVFLVLSVLGIALVAIKDVQVPAMVGVGNYHVSLNLPESGGLYRYSNVTYRGVTIGRVADVSLTDDAVRADLELHSSVHVPKNVKVSVHSMSAIGEQYVDLVPSSTDGPYLQDGDVLTGTAAALPEPVDALLGQAQTLLASVPKDQLHSVIDESFAAFNNSAPQLSRLLDSSIDVIGQASRSADAVDAFVRQLGPLLDDQVVTSDQIRSWVADLAGVTAQVHAADPSVRDLLEHGPDMTAKADSLLTQLQPTVPLLLQNLTSLGQVLLTYNPAIEQLLVLLPPLEAAQTAVVQTGAPDHAAAVDFVVEANDPAACSTGYLPPSQWRTPNDLTPKDTPSNLFCKVPRDSKFAVRGTRNLPCLAVPGKRAPTPDICSSPQQYTPTGENGPNEIEGSNSTTAGGAPGPQPGPTVGAAQYDPKTGTYVGPDGKTYAISGDHAAHQEPGAGGWQSLMTK